MRYSIAELLALPCFVILAVGINGYINYLTIDIRFECVMWFGVDDWELHRKLPRWLFERILDIAGRPVDYAIACLAASVLIPFNRFVRVAGFTILLTVPLSCFHSEVAPSHVHRWLELPIAMLLVCAYLRLCRRRSVVTSSPANITAIVAFTILGILALALLSRLPEFPVWHYRT